MYKILYHIGKVYIRGVAATFIGANIVHIHNNSLKNLYKNMEGKFIISTTWPIIIPLIAMAEADRGKYKTLPYFILLLWIGLIIWP